MKKLCAVIIALILFAPNIGECAGILNTLKSGDIIGIIAPGTYAESSDLYRGIEVLRSHGYRVKAAPSSTAMYEHFAGTDRRRAEDINNMFRDDSVKAILCLKGGYGSARTLGMLDYKMIAKHPKPFIGFSDVTALHIALAKKANIPTIHGAMLVSFTTERFISDYTTQNFFSGLTNPNPIGEIPMPEGYKLETVTPGHAEGVIIGGNLTVLTSLVGTPYELDGKGAILFLEEVGELPYRIDRMLNQLYQNGLLRRVSGIILGEFTNCEDDDADGVNDFTLDDVLKHYARISRKPVIKGVPAGHGKYNMFLPFGVHAVMNANDDGAASLVIDSSPFMK